MTACNALSMHRKENASLLVIELSSHSLHRGEPPLSFYALLQLEMHKDCWRGKLLLAKAIVNAFMHFTLVAVLVSFCEGDMSAYLWL